MILSPTQKQAVAAVCAWLDNWRAGRSAPFFYLAGFAGSGKTTLAKTMAESLRSVCYASYTGKAAHVMRSKGCDGASTIHSLIYEYVDDDDGKPRFELNRDSLAGKVDLIIVDECSMVDAELGHDLLSFRRPVLVLGDPAQLPPVSGAGFFTKGEPDFLLTEVHRQGLDSPILRLATSIRQGEPVKKSNEPLCSVVRKADLDPDAWRNHDQILVGTNAMRRIINRRVRRLLSHEGWIPRRTERLICLRNNKNLGLFNGQLWNVVDCLDMESKLYLTIATDGAKVNCLAHPEIFKGEEVAPRHRRDANEFDFSYAITGHKSQGSEWGSVLAFDQSRVFGEDARRWLYTVVTRAADRLTLVV